MGRTLYSEDYKKHIVKQVMSRNIGEIANENNINYNTLYSWMKKYGRIDQSNFTNNTVKSNISDKRVVHLENEVNKILEENKMLKTVIRYLLKCL